MANKHNTQNPRLCALRVADPDLFVKEVIVAIEKHEGNIAKASGELDVERRTLFMWLEDYPQLKKATTAARKTKVEAIEPREKPARKRKRKAA
jgi:hypothetical protein